MSNSDIPFPDFLGGGANGGPNGLNKRYANPFYGVPYQFLPMQPDHMLWWAQHFLFRFGFYRTVLSRVANYFITELQIECDDSEAKKKYEEAFESMLWKEVLGMTGFNLLAYGNVFASISQGFDRFVKCGNPKCGRISNLDKLLDYQFTAKGEFICTCGGCKQTTSHEVIDKPSKDLERLQVVFWNPREIKMRSERTNNAAEYYWEIPKAYVTQVMTPNNKFFSKRTPKVVYDAILNEKMLAFKSNNFIHLKVPTPAGIQTDGKAIPHCIYMFDDFFMLKVIQRYNEALMFEDIIPFRVFSMAQQGSGNVQVNPILHQGGGQWLNGIKNMIRDHRQDPGSYHMFPFQFQYDQLGGDATKLAPTELIQNSISNILNALNVPQELYSMTLQIQAMGPSLRLFENSYSYIIDIYNRMLDKWGDVISKINGLPKAKISLLPVTLADDMERKSVIAQLVSSNSIARSEMLKIYGLDYREQVRKKMEEDEIMQEMQQEQQQKQQLQAMMNSGVNISDGSSQQAGSTPGDVLDKAQQIAQQLFPMDAAGRRAQLQQIKATDQTLWGAVKAQLEQMGNSAKSQGLSQAKQQGQQGGQGGQGGQPQQ